jgi:peroxiredoxin
VLNLAKSAKDQFSARYVEEELATGTVLTLEGDTIKVGNLWKNRTIVLTFIRQYGCLFCRQQVAELRARRAEIEKYGATIVLIGCGEPSEANEFVEKLDLDLELYTDPGLKSFDAAGLKRGVLTALKRGSWRAGRDAWRSGFRQAKTAGNVWQQGGMFVLDQQGQIHFEHISEWAGDHPDLDEVLLVLSSQ